MNDQDVYFNLATRFAFEHYPATTVGENVDEGYRYFNKKCYFIE